MISKRMKYLLLEAAKCFDENYSPFSSEWLSKHEVTLDECGDLSELIGLILRGVASSNELTQTAILIQTDSSSERVVLCVKYMNANSNPLPWKRSPR